jgi:predicted DNA-binding WGR domain protein
MTEEPQDTYLHRIDPNLNMARYYAIAIQPTLFRGQFGRAGMGTDRH